MYFDFRVLALSNCIVLTTFLVQHNLILPAVIFVEVLKCTEQILLLFHFMFVHHGSKELSVINAATLVYINLHRTGV